MTDIDEYMKQFKKLKRGVDPKIANNEGKDKYLKQLKSLKRSVDPEAAHSDADQILCDLLTELGYEDIVDAYNAVPKWYD